MFSPFPIHHPYPILHSPPTTNYLSEVDAATAREVLAEARAGKYAVPAFDCVEDVMVRTILETAEAHRSPVFLMCLVPDLEGNGWAYLPGLIRAVADHHRIPVVLHLDHANELQSIAQAVRCGFSSVMIDGSSLPFERT